MQRSVQALLTRQLNVHNNGQVADYELDDLSNPAVLSPKVNNTNKNMADLRERVKRLERELDELRMRRAGDLKELDELRSRDLEREDKDKGRIHRLEEDLVSKEEAALQKLEGDGDVVASLRKQIEEAREKYDDDIGALEEMVQERDESHERLMEALEGMGVRISDDEDEASAI